MPFNEAFFRFGLPLGSAMILAGLIDSAQNLFSAWMDMGSIFIYHINDSKKIDPIVVIWILMIVIWNLSNLLILWVGVIIKGNIAMLIAWIATTVVCGFIVLLVYIYVASTAWDDWVYVLAEIYGIFTHIFITAYLINVAIKCLKAFRGSQTIEPIGKGIRHIFKFYSDDPTLAGKLLLISELIIIGEYVFTRQVLLHIFHEQFSGHEADSNPGIIAEEYVIRALRFLISAVGIYFVVKGKIRELKYWGITYGAVIGMSSIILIYLIFAWKAEHPLFTAGYYVTFLISLLYRSCILYVCMKVVRPYRSSNTFATLQET